MYSAVRLLCQSARPPERTGPLAVATPLTNQLAKQHEAECIDIEAVGAIGPLDLPRQLARRCPEVGVVEEQAGLKFDPAEAWPILHQWPARIDVETCQPRQDARILPLLELSTGWDKRQLLAYVALVRAWQAVDECITFMTLATSTAISR